MPSQVERAGKVFGRWSVLSELPERSPSGAVMWNCICECGSTGTITGYALRSGHTKSCGCFHSDELTKRNVTHGDTGGRHYSRWQGIKSRTTNKNHAAYSDYGGRGVTLHGPWQDDFVSFRDWLDNNLGPCPEGWTLDRIDVNGNYEPDNLRWLSRSEQNCPSNRRDK